MNYWNKIITKIRVNSSTYYPLTIMLWIIFTIIISILVSTQGHTHTVTTDYMLGSSRWLQSKDLYNHTGGGFIYLPTSAVFFIPFTYLASLSFPSEEIIWRIISLGLLIYALYRFVNLAEYYDKFKTFFIISIVSIPIAFSSARNGQFNIILAAMMLLAVVYLANRKWWHATLFLVIGLAIKPTILPLLLLAWALYRPLWWRMPLTLLCVFLLPFLYQNPQYVMHQYLNSITMLQETANLGILTTSWAQIFGLISQLDLIVPATIQLSVTACFALLTLYGCLIIKKEYHTKYSSILIFSLAACYLMLFNPRTENNDYIILAPAIGIFLSIAWQERSLYKSLFLVIITIGIINSYYLSKLINPHPYGNCWIAPLMAVIFTCYISIEIFGHLNRKILFGKFSP